jgi:hypothetical protein
MPKKLRVQSSHDYSARGLDAYFTCPEAVRSLVHIEAQHIPRRIWEPAAGNGAISRILQEAGREVVSTDLADYGWEGCRSGIDYLSALPQPSVQGIVTNPPFRLAVRFARKAISEAPYVALLLRTNFLESKGRLPFFRRTPPTRIWVSSSRLPFMHRYKWEGKKSSSNTCYAWFIWQAGAAREPNGWFDWNEICQPLPLFVAAA